MVSLIEQHWFHPVVTQPLIFFQHYVMSSPRGLEYPLSSLQERKKSFALRISPPGLSPYMCYPIYDICCTEKEFQKDLSKLMFLSLPLTPSLSLFLPWHTWALSWGKPKRRSLCFNWLACEREERRVTSFFKKSQRSTGNGNERKSETFSRNSFFWAWTHPCVVFELRTHHANQLILT